MSFFNICFLVATHCCDGNMNRLSFVIALFNSSFIWLCSLCMLAKENFTIILLSASICNILFENLYSHLIGLYAYVNVNLSEIFSDVRTHQMNSSTHTIVDIEALVVWSSWVKDPKNDNRKSWNIRANA